MRCFRCGADKDSVIDSRADGALIRRRRECNQCGYRFSTLERIEIVLPMVVKKDGRREAFSSEKVRKGLERACEKRPIGSETIGRLLECLEVQITERGGKEITTNEIGMNVLVLLRDVDQIAYVRFASVYGAFSTIDQFLDILSSLQETAQISNAVGEL